MELEQDFNSIDSKLLYNGYVLIQNIPEVAAVNYTRRLGDFILQKGSIKHTVKWTEGFDGYAYSKSMNFIGPHTEFPYLKIPPTYQALYCRRQADSGGETYLSNANYFLESLDKADKELLKKTTVNFLSINDSDNIDSNGNIHPIYEEIKEDIIFRFSHNLFMYGDINAKLKDVEENKITFFENEKINTLMTKLLNFTRSNHTCFQIPTNSILIWNNHRILHWRNQYSDKHRELVRLLIQ